MVLLTVQTSAHPLASTFYRVKVCHKERNKAAKVFELLGTAWVDVKTHHNAHWSPELSMSVVNTHTGTGPRPRLKHANHLTKMTAYLYVHSLVPKYDIVSETADQTDFPRQ